MFRAGEAEVCPACGLALEPLAKLGPSYDAQIESDWPSEPEWEPLPFTYVGRGRAALMLASAIGAILFFLPWIRETAPDLVDLSGYDIAHRLGWLWACLVSWAMLVPILLSRRSVMRMRGARAAVSLFCAIPLIGALVLLSVPPRPPSNIRFPFAFHFGYGLYGTIVLALLALPFAVSFGGRVGVQKEAQGNGKGGQKAL